MSEEDFYEKLKCDVSRETFFMIKRYEELISSWNTKINLVSRRLKIEDIRRDHIAQSIELAKILPKDHIFLDVGSGAGFPGMILSILGFNICLCEINAKRASFLKFANAELGCSAIIENCCVSKLAGYKFDYILSRSVTNIETLIKLTKNVAKIDTTYVVYVPNGINLDHFKNNYFTYVLTIGNDYVNNHNIAMLKSINAD